MKLLSSLLALFLLFAAPTSSVPSKKDLIWRTELSVVRIDTRDEDWDNLVCTGFVVNAARGEAITARHCVNLDAPLFVDKEESEILKVDETFALVSVPVMSRPPLELRAAKAEPGEPVVAIGYGYGSLLVFSRNVAALEKGDVALDGTLAPGMSGGPIVDERGKVVALTQVSNYVMSGGCGVGEMQDFLKKKSKGF